MTPERIAKLRQVLNCRQPDLTLVTDYVHKGRNLSALVRTADAVGIGEVHCALGDQDFQTFRGTASGSHNWVKVNVYNHLNEVVPSLKQQGFQIVAAHFSEQAVDYHEVDFTKPTALLMGAEKNGLSELGGQLADIHVTVPMVGMVGSFNVSVAAGIILSEARHQRQQAGLYGKQRISNALYQRLFFEWGHPKVRDFCLENDLMYPVLNEEGEIHEPAKWYAEARQLIAERQHNQPEGG